MMPARKLRLEVYDAQGNRYTLTCEGNVNKEKVLHLLNFVEQIDSREDEHAQWRRTSSGNTKFEMVRALIEQHFALQWFSSQDVKKICEQELNEVLSLSTVSTYLLRLADRGFLLRKGSANQRRYKALTLAFGGKADILKDDK